MATKQSLKQLQDALAAQLKGNIGQDISEGDLTDDELAQRQSLFQQAGQTSGTIDHDRVQEEIANKLKAYGVTTNTDGVAGRITEMIERLGRYPSPDELINALKTNSIWSKDANKPVGIDGTTHADDLTVKNDYVPPELMNFIHSPHAGNELSAFVQPMLNAPNTANDVARVQDILSSRQEQATNEKSLQDYLSGLPDELATNRNQYLQSVDEQNAQQFNDVLAPQALESLNARGALFSGDVGDVLASTAGNLQSNREQMQAQLEGQDNAFYFNAAYQNTLRQQLQGQTNYAQALAGERQQVLTNQQNQFQQAQTQLNANNQTDLMMRQYQQSLKARQIQDQRQQDYANSQRQSGLYGQIGQVGGTLAGLGIASAFPGVGVAGLALGGGLGGSLGGGLGGLFPSVGGRQ